jgi:predicted SAM-dependent methyltransferase
MGMTLKEYLQTHGDGPVCLHLGCGGKRWKDFINVDLYPHDASVPDSSRSGCVADAFADIRNLGLPDDSVDEIFTSHTFEHFTRWQGVEMLADWHRILKPKGKLVLETPDFWRCVLWLFHPSREKRRLGRTQFYGNQWDKIDYETHRYVWSAGEIKETCMSAGFSRIRVTHRSETHYPGRDMRVEAIK